MKKIMIMVAMLVGIGMATFTFSSCSSNDDEPSASGDLVSGVVPSRDGWTGNSSNGVCTYLPTNVDAEMADVYYAFSFSDGICTDAVFNVVCSSESEANYIASILNSGTWTDGDEDDYYALRKSENGLMKQLFTQSISIKQTFGRNLASLSRATSMVIPCTQKGKVVFFKLEIFKNCSAEDVKIAMKMWDVGLEVSELPTHCIFGEWNASTGKYTANNVYGFLNVNYEIVTKFDGGLLDEFVTTLTMPSEEWAMNVEASWLEDLYEYEQQFGAVPEVTRSGKKVTMKALILDDLNKEQTLQIIVVMDILNHMPFYVSMF